MYSFCHRVCQLLVAVQFDFRTFRPFFLFVRIPRKNITFSCFRLSTSWPPSIFHPPFALQQKWAVLEWMLRPKTSKRTVHSSFTQTAIISTAYLSERRLEPLSQLSCRQILAWSLQRMSKAGYDLASICGNYGPWLPGFHR